MERQAGFFRRESMYPTSGIARIHFIWRVDKSTRAKHQSLQIEFHKEGFITVKIGITSQKDPNMVLEISFAGNWHHNYTIEDNHGAETLVDSAFCLMRIFFLEHTPPLES